MDIDAIMQTLGDPMAKNPEEDDEDHVGINVSNDSEDDAEIMDVSDTLN